jgi:hypothetical protein
VHTAPAYSRHAPFTAHQDAARAAAGAGANRPILRMHRPVNGSPTPHTVPRPIGGTWRSAPPAPLRRLPKRQGTDQLDRPNHPAEPSERARMLIEAPGEAAVPAVDEATKDHMVHARAFLLKTSFDLNKLKERFKDVMVVSKIDCIVLCLKPPMRADADTADAPPPSRGRKKTASPISQSGAHATTS